MLMGMMVQSLQCQLNRSVHNGKTSAAGQFRINSDEKYTFNKENGLGE